MKFRLLLLLLPLATALSAREVSVMRNGSLPPLPGQTTNPGVAGAFAGVHGGAILVAGGSDFAEGGPWEGGTKIFRDFIYVISQDRDGALSAEITSARFPGGGIAHGQAVSLGDGVFCFGGQRGDGPNRNVYRLSYSGGEVRSDIVSSLPGGFVPVAVAASGNTVYLHGVEAGLNAMFSYHVPSDLWTRLDGCPAGTRSEGVVFARQHNGEQEAFYLMGGRHTDQGEARIYGEVWQYTPGDGRWTRKGDILPGGCPGAVMAAAAVPYGSGHIIIIGGDDGEEFSRRYDLEYRISSTGNPREADSLRSELEAAFKSHGGFSRNILAYHTITDTWVKIGEGDFPLPVATAALLYNGNIVVPSGESKPAVRTPDILVVRIGEKAGFGWVNYTVVVVYLLLMLGVGFYFMRRENSTEQFFKGGSRIPWWAAGISIFATALSAITFLSIPAKAYGSDWTMIIFNMAIILVVPLVICFYLPYFRNLKVASAYEYLEMRFSKGIRLLAASFFTVFMFARIAIVLFLPSLALNAVTGLDIYLCIILMGVVTVVYCTMGGIEAVVWGDVIQGIILVGGALLCLVYMVTAVDGGVREFIAIALDDAKLRTFDFSFDLTRPVFWVAIVGGLANQLLTYTSDQSVIQRYMTTKDTAGARKGIWLNGWLSIPVALIFFGIGTGLYVFFKTRPELLNLGMQNTDSIFPHFMMVRLPVGVAGLLIAAVFAAAMSTLSSNINSISTILTVDFLGQLKRQPSDKAKMVFARLSGIVIGGLGILTALLLATYDIASLWDQFNFFLGLLTSGIGGLFMMGIFIKRIDWRGALAGFVGSIAILLIFNGYSQVSFLLYGFIGLVSCCGIGYLASFILPRRDKG
ncbi:MAG: sodium/solute symporter [Alistipes sp.]|nr:sodium/solute symporter [Alistipes sp.]